MGDKREIRAAMKARRKAVAPEERARVSGLVCRSLLGRSDVRTAIAEKAPIAVYLASPDEIDLAAFIETALKGGAVLVAPRWNGTAYELSRLTSLVGLAVGPHGILEPPSSPIPRPSSLVPHPSSLVPRIWLVPGLAFTADGRRLGYGGGWYDRLLAGSDSSLVRLGIAYGFQLMEDLPSEPHDVALTEIVSA